jgi:hypothetical protein
MGFEQNAIYEALTVSDGDKNAALEYLSNNSMA